MTAVTNETAFAIIHSCRQFPEKIGRLYAAYCGISGIILEEFVDTTIFDDYELDKMRYTPGGVFGGDRTFLRS